ncbi:MAG TPA: hypothetical protein VGF91_18975 [Solirubrobacteraceae bacterium]
MIGRLGCAVALVLALGIGGCGSAQRSQTTTTTIAQGAGQGPTLHFTGGSVPGTVYVGGGPDELSLDAYRLSGPLSKAQRITYSPVGLGIQGLGANQSEVAIQRICCGGLMFIEQLNLARHGGLPGTVLGSGGGAGLAPDGQFAHIVPDYPGCNCDALLLRPSVLGPDRVIYRDPHPGTILGDAWSVQNRLAAMIATTAKDGTFRNTEIVLYPGTSRQQTIKPAAMLDVQSGIWWGPRGELSYEIFGPRVVIRSAAGQSRSFLLGDSHATCWLHNDTIFTVNELKGTFGSLNPSTGTITTIGKFPSSQALFVLDCPH